MRSQLEYPALVMAARAAREQAYAPYSRFAVGAAALTASGRIFPGCNVENAAYPACLCAERVALVSAYAAGEHEIVALAVVADTPGPVSPCGTCRQVILELAPRCVITLANMRGDTLQTTPDALLPGGFTAESLPD
jgi:cytidine deaminase